MEQNIASKEYEKATRLISELCIMSFGAKGKEKIPESMAYFDEILQAIGLLTALADGELHPNEIDLIKSLSQNGGIEARINSQAKFQNPDWEYKTLEELICTEENKKYLEELTKNSVVMHTQTFCQMFAKCDYAIPGKNYLEELKNSVKGIVNELTAADGDAPDSDDRKIEFAAGVKAFEDILEMSWKNHYPKGRVTFVRGRR